MPRHVPSQVKAWAKLFQSVCTTARLELELLYHVQVQCYEDAKLQRVFPEFIRTLYDLDVLAEDSILLWYHKGTNPKGRWVGRWQAWLRAGGWVTGRCDEGHVGGSRVDVSKVSWVGYGQV